MSKFPLPSNFFRCPPLNVDESARLMANADSIAIDMVRYTRVNDGPVTWCLKSDDMGMKIYKGDDSDAPPGTISYLCVTEVVGTIEEVAELFRTDTTEEYQEYSRVFMKDILDSQTLYTLRRRTAANPRHTVALKWYAHESPFAGLVKCRDWCFLETQNDFELDGKMGWTRGFKSVTLSCCPDLQNSLGLVRGVHHRTGYCFLQSNRPGYLEVAQIIQCDLKGSLSEGFIEMGIKKRCRNMAHLDTFLRQKRLSQGTFLHEAELVPRASRSKCFVCQRKFGAFSKKGRCRKCGEVVCRRCSQEWNIMTSGIMTRRRVCTACSCGTVEVSTDANTIVDEQSDEQHDSSQSETPRGLQLQPPSSNGSSLYVGDSKRKASNHQLSLPSPSGQVVLIKPKDDYYHRAPRQALAPPPGALALRREDLLRLDMEQPPMAQDPRRVDAPLSLPAPPVDDAAHGGWDEDQSTVVKDDMSNYSESIVSYHQSVRGGGMAPHHYPPPPSAGRYAPEPEYMGRSQYDRRVPESRQAAPSSREAHGVTLMHSHNRSYPPQQQPSYHQHPPHHQHANHRPQSVNPYTQPPASHHQPHHGRHGGSQSHHFQPKLRYQSAPAHPNQQQRQQPRHQFHDPRPQSRHHPRGVDPYHQMPNQGFNHHQHELVLRKPREQQQMSYLQRHHDFLQEADGTSSYGGSQGSHHSRDDCGPPNQYSNLYSYQPREQTTNRHSSALGERNDLIMAPPPAPTSASRVLQAAKQQM
ncbi:Aste57867_9790 [Aphanomyces stellatus]|uniref:Aste57867_9790 protein n=1 Tax=Aphanomyces stellatus TaxID=120398 RepID=A0A485KPC1_9STRA|nr:hypothetical protein As57867_009751 [Aphanomyces stellatus]VFT86669.1 Aste57867_9790 [Aphanomyces stellatus]